MVLYFNKTLYTFRIYFCIIEIVTFVKFDYNYALIINFCCLNSLFRESQWRFDISLKLMEPILNVKVIVFVFFFIWFKCFRILWVFKSGSYKYKNILYRISWFSFLQVVTVVGEWEYQSDVAARLTRLLRS